MKVLVATANQKKLIELRRILDQIVEEQSDSVSVELVNLQQVTPYQQSPETGATFVDNALLKAREGVEHTGLVTVADDSGLAIDALNGMPGVLSARWSGGHGTDVANYELVLAQLADIPQFRRTAQFVCAAALVTPDGSEYTVSETMPGKIIDQPVGSGGFGYDPIFVPDGYDVTAAQLPPADKDAISHRGKAFRGIAATIIKLAHG